MSSLFFCAMKINKSVDRWWEINYKQGAYVLNMRICLWNETYFGGKPCMKPINPVELAFGKVGPFTSLSIN